MFFCSSLEKLRLLFPASDKVDLSIVLGPRGLFSIQFGMYVGVILVQKKLFNNSA